MNTQTQGKTPEKGDLIKLPMRIRVLHKLFTEYRDRITLMYKPEPWIYVLPINIVVIGVKNVPIYIDDVNKFDDKRYKETETYVLTKQGDSFSVSYTYATFIHVEIPKNRMLTLEELRFLTNWMINMLDGDLWDWNILISGRLPLEVPVSIMTYFSQYRKGRNDPKFFIYKPHLANFVSLSSYYIEIAKILPEELHNQVLKTIFETPKWLQAQR